MADAFEFRYGADGVPFHVSGRGTAVDGAGRLPFHGIISRGLLERAQRAAVPFAPWESHGQSLHDPTASPSAALACWRQAASECDVLSFAESAAVARAYVERLASARARCVLWNVKEGHTSSVWRARIEDGARQEEFAVNVARDRAAGQELARTARTMQRIYRDSPDVNMARVLDIAAVRRAGGERPVVVTRNEWIADSQEIHRVPALGPGPGRLVLVERFLTDDSAPARVRRIQGRILSAAECEQVERDLREFLERTAGSGVQIDINDGDLVWNGKRAVAIAIR